MENWATNTGTGTTVGADGAFERFLTAAIATIITIMFSWRLLVENGEENGDVNAYQLRQHLLAVQGAAGGGPPGDPEEQGDSDGSRHQGPHGEPIPASNQRSHLTSGHDVMECKHETQSHSSQSTYRISGHNLPPMDEDGNRTALPVGTRGEEVNGSDEEEQPAWGYNNWEEDAYWNINTRRKPRDFMTSKVRTRSESSDQSYTGGSDSSDPDGGGVVATSEGEDEQYVNREYRSIVENDGYTNMMGDKSSDSETSESEEGDYEPPMIDSDDDDANYSNSLEPIIEEDSDDMCASEDESNDESGEGKRDNENNDIAYVNENIDQNTYDKTLSSGSSRYVGYKDNDTVNGHRRNEGDTDETRTATNKTVEGTDVDSPVCVIHAELNRRDPSYPADIPVVPGADDTSSDHVDLFTSGREGPGPAIVNVIERERSRVGDTEHCMNESRIPKLDINKYHSRDIDLNTPADDSSVTESPVRTCAVEDIFDGYISDESCSSASVVTVVSVDVDDDEDGELNQNRSTDRTLLGSGGHREPGEYPKQGHSIGSLSDDDDNASDSNSEECFDGDENCVEKSDSVIHIPQLVESEWAETETNNNRQSTVGLKDGVIDIDFIQEDNGQKTQEFTYSDFITEIKVSSEETLPPTGEVHETPNSTLIAGIKHLNSEAPAIRTEVDRDRDPSEGADRDGAGTGNTLSDEEMFALSQLASIPEEGEEQVGNEGDTGQESYSCDEASDPQDTVKFIPIEQECVEQLETVNKSTPERSNVSVISYQNIDEEEEEEDEFTDSSIPDKTVDDVPRFQNISTNIQDYVNSSDDDVEPREYNPYDDDFAEFEFDHDSDEDSFFLVMGDQSHLRKLDTVTNLDALGLNPSNDGYDVQPGADGKSVVFTKTEEVYTDHRVRYFTEDRVPSPAETYTHNTIHEQDEDTPNEHSTDTGSIPNGVIGTDMPCVMNGVNNVHGDKPVSEEDLSDTDLIPDTIDRSACNRSGFVIRDNDRENNTESNKSSKNDLLFEHNQLEQSKEISSSLDNTRDMSSDNDRTSDSHSDLSSADMTGSGDIRMRSLQENVIEQSSRESLDEALHIDEEQDSGIQCNSFSPNQSGLSSDNRQFSVVTDVCPQDIESQNTSGSCDDVSNVELFINESDLNIDQTEHEQENHTTDKRQHNETDLNNKSLSVITIKTRANVFDDVSSSCRSKETVIDDISPPTRHKETVIDDISPPTRQMETVIDDISPPTRQKETVIDDILPPTRQTETVIDDISPSNRQKETVIDDISPPTRQKENVIDDISPPTRQKETVIDDISPSNLQKETVIDNISPPSRQKETVIYDISPSNRQKETVIDDISPPNRQKETVIDDISTPTRQMETVIDDISPSNRQMETVIDDISPSNRQKETVIDDILLQPTVIGQVFTTNNIQKHTRETKTPKGTIIDDCSNSHHREIVTHDRLPTYHNDVRETAIDDISTSTIKETIIGNIIPSTQSIESSIGDISRQTVNTQSPVKQTDLIHKAMIRNHKPHEIVTDVSTSLPVTIKRETKCETVIDDPAKLDVMNSSTLDDLESAIAPCIEQYTKSVNSPTKLQPDVGLEPSFSEKVLKQEKATDSDEPNEYKNIPVVPMFGWVVRTSVVSPSGLKGIKAKISKQQERSRVRKPDQYKSVLTEPVVINPSPPVVRTLDQRPLPVIRQKIMSSRHRFLSADNLTDNVSSQFEHFKMSVSKTPTRQRIYTRRETTPAQKTRRILSFERVDNLSSLHSPRHNSDDSFEKPALDTLHKDCIFSAHKHKEIQNTTDSIDQLHEPLLSYGSVSSLVETDIDSGETYETFFLHETDVDMFGFQHIPLQRTASMSDMMTSRNLEEQKARKGRFADRNMPKSKSLMALETDIDEEVEGDGSLKRVPSIHELRVAKSLQKLNVPDWYKRSSVSRSGSTYSLLSERRDSTSTLNSIGYAMSTTSCPCPSISPTSGAVVIKTRVTPSSANRFLRAPKLPVTPEKSPLPHLNFRLPSDRLRNKDKSKELMPIPVVPFSQLRLMFETGKKKTSPVKKSPSTKSEKTSPLTSPDVPDHPATSPVTSSAPHPILKVTHADQPPTNGTTTGSRDEENRVKNGRVRISEPEVTNVKPAPPEKPASLSKKEASQEKPTTPTKKGFFSHFKKQKSSSTKSAPVAPPVEPEKLKPSIKPPVPAKPAKSRKETTV